MTVPNLLCLSRIVAAPLLAHLIIEKGDFGLALAVFAFAGVTDMVNNSCSLQRIRSPWSNVAVSLSKGNLDSTCLPQPSLPLNLFLRLGGGADFPEPETTFSVRRIHCSKDSWASIKPGIVSGSSGRQGPRHCALPQPHLRRDNPTCPHEPRRQPGRPPCLRRTIHSLYERRSPCMYYYVCTVCTSVCSVGGHMHMVVRRPDSYVSFLA